MKINGEEWTFRYRFSCYSVFGHADGRRLIHYRTSPVSWRCQADGLESAGLTAAAAIATHSALRRKAIARELQDHLDTASALRAELAKMGGTR